MTAGPCRSHLKAQIIRELDRLELLLAQLKTVEAERDALLKPARTDEADPAPAMLVRLKGIGPERRRPVVGGPVPPVRQPPAGGRLCGSGADALAERLDRSRAGGLQGGQPAAAHDHDPAGLAMAAAPAALSPQPVVPRAGQSAAAAASARRPSSPWPASSRRPVEVRHRRRRHRGGDDEGRMTPELCLIEHLPGPDQSWRMQVGEPNTAMASPAAVQEGSRRPEPRPPQAG